MPGKLQQLNSMSVEKCASLRFLPAPHRVTRGGIVFYFNGQLGRNAIICYNHPVNVFARQESQMPHFLVRKYLSKRSVEFAGSSLPARATATATDKRRQPH
jgi:hypothetical protein